MGLGRELLNDYAWELEQGEPDMMPDEQPHWINTDSSLCSKCGHRFPRYIGMYSYCPSCGAKMRS